MEEHLYFKITAVTSMMTKILMSEPLPSRTEEVQVMSRQKLKVAMELLNRPHDSDIPYVSTWPHTVAGLPTVWGQKIRYCTYCVSLSGTVLLKIRNLGVICS
jgi:hypothetical protein